jgi:hypothetical protein
MPIPWGRLGGAEPDPSLEVSLAGLRIANPIALAAGFDKTGRHVDALERLGFGYVVCGTFTRRAPRRASEAPYRPLPAPHVDGQRDGPAEPRRGMPRAATLGRIGRTGPGSRASPTRT